MSEEKKQSEIIQGKAVVNFAISSLCVASSVVGLSLGGPDHGVLGEVLFGLGALCAPFAAATLQMGIQNTLSAHRAAGREEAEAMQQKSHPSRQP